MAANGSAPSEALTHRVEMLPQYPELCLQVFGGRQLFP